MVKKALLPTSWIFGFDNFDGNNEVDELGWNGHSYPFVLEQLVSIPLSSPCEPANAHSLDEGTGSQAHMASFRLTKLMSLNELIE
jgi:hypothetical protein